MQQPPTTTTPTPGPSCLFESDMCGSEGVKSEASLRLVHVVEHQ